MSTIETTGADLRTNWAGNVTYRAREVVRPTTLDELRTAVTSNPRVTALGSRHSFNLVADTDGVQIALGAMPEVIEIDSERRVARVAAGLTHARAAAALDEAGFALANLASLPHISVAGAVATGTHGSGVRNASLASSVVGVEIVRASGDVEVLDADHPDLDAHRVGIGALGVVTAVHLAIEPRFDVAQRIHTGLPWEVVDARFEDVMSAGYSVSMFTGYVHDGIRQVWTKRRVDRDDPVVDLEDLGAMPSTSPLHPVPGSDNAGVTEQAGVPGPWHERLPHFRSSFTPSAGAEIQCEYLLPASDAVPAIQALRGIGEAMAPVLYVSEIRRVAADTAWLAPSSERDSVAFHFTFHRDPEGVAAVLPLIDAALAPFDARPHWGKVTAMPADQLHAVYPRLGEFAALADRVDPERRFRNPFLTEVLG
ncbi:FAD-binding protein [Curtobacterium sp. MCBD17_019]|uniref:FAD-binding protein n=1 Tax=Curtobacterium sp. MCBD17_019 TaxID=2175669 RepID=UPI000DA861FE|nr:FAD-binding protein [Curtobacterium sp. MCBD17_019]PZE77649.1 FAD-binding protein [Curtobacterium sp. MCBD17_019]